MDESKFSGIRFKSTRILIETTIENSDWYNYSGKNKKVLVDFTTNIVSTRIPIISTRTLINLIRKF